MVGKEVPEDGGKRQGGSRPVLLDESEVYRVRLGRRVAAPASPSRRYRPPNTIPAIHG